MARKKTDERARHWGFIAYETSVKETFVQILNELGLQGCISPKHDRDVHETDAKDGSFKKGETKKAHWHCCLTFDGKKSEEQIRQITSAIVNDGEKPYQPIRLMSLRGTLRYFMHLDNPEKAQYDIAEMQVIGGLDVMRIINTKEDDELNVAASVADIIKLINEHQLADFCVLTEYLINTGNAEGFNTLRKNSYFFGQYLKSKKTFNQPKEKE